jgi:hypothetical protein
MFVPVYQVARHHIPEDSSLYVRIWLLSIGLPIISFLLLHRQELVMRLVLDTKR